MFKSRTKFFGKCIQGQTRTLSKFVRTKDLRGSEIVPQIEVKVSEGDNTLTFNEMQIRVMANVFRRFLQGRQTRGQGMKEHEFFTATGRLPEDDDLERVNCNKVGQAGHFCCGWCFPHNLPVFECGCITIENRAKAKDRK